VERGLKKLGGTKVNRSKAENGRWGNTRENGWTPGIKFANRTEMLNAETGDSEMREHAWYWGGGEKRER